MKILLVEDNQNIRDGLVFLFNQNNMFVTEASNYKDAKLKLYENTFDVIILDISLPDGNGIDLYKKFIDEIKTPTIFLTAKDDEETIVNCLDMGAYDYIIKPFRTKELLARINKIIRLKNDNVIINVKDIFFDVDKMEVFKNDKKIDLTSLELKILHFLFINLNKVVRRDAIIDKVWEWTGNDIEDNTVTVYLKRIREKLDSDIILTIKGVGYRIDSYEK